MQPKDSRNSGGASPPRAAAQNAGKAGVSHSFLPSSCPRRCDLQNTQKRNRQSILVFLYFVFISASLSLFSVSDLLLSTDRFFSFCFSFSVSGGRLYDQEGRRLLGFCRVWPAEMEKKSAGLIAGFSCLCCCHLRLLELRWRWERLLAGLRRRSYGCCGACWSWIGRERGRFQRRFWLEKREVCVQAAEEDGGRIQVCERRCVRAGLEEAGGGGGLLLWRSSMLNGLHPCRW